MHNGVIPCYHLAEDGQGHPFGHHVARLYLIRAVVIHSASPSGADSCAAIVSVPTRLVTVNMIVLGGRWLSYLFCKNIH